MKSVIELFWESHHRYLSGLRRGTARTITSRVGSCLLVPVAISSLVLVSGCGQQEPVDVAAEETPAAVDAEPAVVEREPLIEIVELEAEEAALESESIRQEVSVNLMDGFELKLWASEQLLGDPVALDIDEQGRAFVTQTTRHRKSEFDIRDRPDWRIPSITWETVEDRRAFLREELAPERSDENQWLADRNEDGSHDWRDLAVLKERVFQIEDTTGDGVANRSQVLYEGFNEEVSDIAAGILAYGDDIYVTVAPDLWRLRDTTGDGWADLKESIIDGFGVHVGFSGHGLSGPTIGPDGRIYWAIGDYGANVVDSDGKRWEYPNTGVIVRSNPDGSDFEVYASGLRNTHEFAFDDYGNLITVDNDGDHSGEHERIVYLVDGSDSGWRINWQFGKYGDPDNNSYKVWMDEELYKPRFDGQAAYILPPLAAFRSGPTGLAYNPGTALRDEWRNFVFVSQFRGNPPQSSVTAFRLEEEGAGFNLAEQDDVLRGLQPTSFAFGPDGALYFTDWIQGWGMNERGRIWKLDTVGDADSDLRKETKALIGENFEERDVSELRGFLEHQDLRVRRKAQFELVNRGDAGEEALLGAANQTDHQLARVHGIWGLGQLIRQGGDQAEAVASLLSDADGEIRGQAAKVLGDVRDAAAAEKLMALLEDDVGRVRFFATEALGRIGHEPALEGIAGMLIENDDEDVYLRHGGAIALARIGQAEPLAAYATHESRALRIASVVALRRMEDAGIAEFLADEDEFVVTEAARGINDDRSIPDALPALARLLEEDRFSEEALLRRAINANLRIGGLEEAQRVAAYAARADAPEAMRGEALDVLSVWAQPSILDRVDGWHRGAVERDPAIAGEAVAPVIDSLLAADSSRIRTAAVQMVGRLQVHAASSALVSLIRQDDASQVRATALNALQSIGSDQLGDAVAAALGDEDGDVRSAALRLAPSLDTGGADLAEMLGRVVDDGSVSEQQTALEALGRVPHERAGELLDGYLDRLLAEDLAREIRLDLIEAVEASGDEVLLTKLGEYRSARPEDKPVAAFRDAMHGGGIDPGRKIFREHPSTSCARCHAVDGQGGDAGPDLTTVGARMSREMLMQALVDPNASIAPGYGIVTLILNDGERVIGTLHEETEGYLEMEVGGEKKRFDTETIAERADAPSSMPSMESILSKRQLRDLVEYLASLK